MILIDGRPGTCIPVQDRGLQYGDGVFESVAVVDGRPLCLDAHLDRLDAGCRALGLPPPDTGRLIQESTQVAAEQARAVLKIIVTRGVGGRGYQPPQDLVPTRIVSIHPWPDYPPECSSIGINAMFCRFTVALQPALAGIKHLNRLEQVLARSEIGATDCAEGFVADTTGAIVEGSMSNVFLRRGRVLLTPDLKDCGVAGIVRAEILKRAATMGLDAKVQRIERADVLAADEAFFTNSIIGVWPVRRAGDHTFAGIDFAHRLAHALADAGCIAPA
jgi:4-amino-4-deoxychorismate lyase